MTPQDWALGTSSTVEGHQEPHPALEALVDGIERRLWHAQVTVLFPLIEEHRLRLVARLRPHLRVPFETPFGVITDPRDLEIGHLLHQIRAFGLRASKGERELLWSYPFWYRIRNLVSAAVFDSSVNHQFFRPPFTRS